MDADPYKYFKIEGPELLEQLNRGALRLRKGDAPRDVVPAMMRHAHTLKGAARIVRCLDISSAAHRLEDLLSSHRDAPALPDPDIIADVLSTLTSIASSLDALIRPAVDPASPQAEKPKADVTHQRTLRTDVGELEDLTRVVGQAIANQARVQSVVETMQSVRRSLDLLSRQLGSGGNAGVATPRWWQSLTARAEDVAAELRGLEGQLDDATSNVAAQLQSVQQRLEALRLVPVERLFTLLERAAVDAALSLHKEVTVTMTGGEHRLDGDVLELLRSGLLHVIRNSVVHGIEAPAVRLTKGKSRSGSIQLSVALRDGDVVLECQDDGAGVNIDEARSRLGLAKDADDRSVLEGLLIGGASTAGQLSELSGRGVGLDVMRDVAERLRGSLELHNEESGGLLLRLRFPASVRLFLGLELESGDLRVTVPLEQVSSIVRLETNARGTAAESGEVLHEGVCIKAFSLARLLGASSAPTEEGTCVIVKGRGGPLALLAGRVGAARQALLRPLPDHAQASTLVAGLVLDAKGVPRVVLDCSGLASVSLRSSEPAGRRRMPRVLVIDDSLTTRMLEQSILEANGYRVELASSAEEGLSRASGESFDLFLVDVEMPGMDGFEFIERAQSDARLRETPAVLVTSRSESADFARAALVGARGYVVKHQFDQHDFLSLIQKLTGAA